MLPVAARERAITTKPHTMQCMEVWGGNSAVDNGVAVPGLDVWVYGEPFRQNERGGDVHYVSSCATGRITRLLLADVSGHGQSVGEMGTKLRTLMRRHANCLDQSRFVMTLNREFNRIANAGGFATAVAATFWAPTNILVTCNAGHPRPLWFRAKDRQWRFLEANSAAQESQKGDDQLVNLPLGVISSTRFEQFGVRLAKGDVVMFYTDSLIEATDATGRFLGERGLLALMQAVQPDHPREMRKAILKRIAAFRQGRDADDDVTVLMLRHNGSKPRAGLKDRIHSNVEFLKSIGRRIVRGSRYPIPWPEIGLTTIGGMFINKLNNRWGGAPPEEADT